GLPGARTVMAVVAGVGRDEREGRQSRVGPGRVVGQGGAELAVGPLVGLAARLVPDEVGEVDEGVVPVGVVVRRWLSAVALVGVRRRISDDVGSVEAGGGRAIHVGAPTETGRLELVSQVDPAVERARRLRTRPEADGQAVSV